MAISEQSIEKLCDVEAKDYFCMICKIGDNWDRFVMNDHYIDYHGIEVYPFQPSIEELLELEQAHLDDPVIISDNETPLFSRRELGLTWTDDSQYFH